MLKLAFSPSNNIKNVLIFPQNHLKIFIHCSRIQIWILQNRNSKKWLCVWNSGWFEWKTIVGFPNVMQWGREEREKQNESNEKFAEIMKANTKWLIHNDDTAYANLPISRFTEFIRKCAHPTMSCRYLNGYFHCFQPFLERSTHQKCQIKPH